MMGLDINVVEFYNDGYGLFDMWADTTTRPSNDTAIGGLLNLFNPDFNITNGIGNVYFERKLDTGDQYDKILTMVSVLKLTIRARMIWLSFGEMVD
jgi:hypothetical protein